ncbi:hypothetical protein PENTCL1PPCAC_25627, partial [Pristionchus entomophagus]
LSHIHNQADIGVVEIEFLIASSRPVNLRETTLIQFRHNQCIRRVSNDKSIISHHLYLIDWESFAREKTRSLIS